MPNLLDIFGTNEEKTPKASNGNVFTKPTMELETSSSSRKNGISGPTEVSGERKVAAIKRIANINKNV